MPAAHLRDDAKTAGMIAAFGDFQINAVRRGEPKTRRVVIGNVSRTRGDEVGAGAQIRYGCIEHTLDDRAQFAHLIEPDESIDFRQSTRAVRRRNAATCSRSRSIFGPVCSLAALLMRFQNRFDRFFLGRIDERAGVNHQHIRFVGSAR